MNQPQSTDPVAPQPRPESTSGCLGLVVLLSSWAYLGVVVALWVLLWWADVWWPATIFLFAPRVVAAVPLLLLVPAALFFRRRSLGVLLFALVLVVGPIMGCCIPWGRLAGSPPAGTPFTVLTCNMHYHSGNMGALAELVAATGPDIVVLQEWGKEDQWDLVGGPGWHVDRTPRLFLASRHPIRKVTRVGGDSDGPPGLVMRYELDTPAGVIHFFNLHLASPRGGIYQALHEEGTTAVRKNMKVRWEQSENVAGAASQVRGPRLLAGDFNTPPESRIFQTVWTDFTDSFGSAGWGWGYTFIGSRTMVRIDHILADQNWYCTSCRVGPDVGSPHRPVIAELICTSPSREQE